MTPRERTLAVILIAGIAAAVVGFVGYQFVWTPLQDANAEATKLQGEFNDLDLKVTKAQKDARRLTDMKKRSLPADKEVAGNEYYAVLEKIMDKAGVNGPTIKPASVDARSIPILTGKTPVYTKVAYEVEFRRANLWQVYDVLTAYYRLNVLHQMTALSIKKDDDAGGRRAAAAGSRNDLTVRFVTEGIILDGAAENRRTLLPVSNGFAAVGGFAGHAAVSQTPGMGRGLNPMQFTQVLATKPRDYTYLVFRDIFHGPYPAPAKLGVESISDVTAKVGEAIPPVKVGFTYDDVINKNVTLSAKSASPMFPPESIKIDPKRGTLTLTPATEEPIENARVTVTATDANGKTASREFKVSISVPTEKSREDISQTIILTSVIIPSSGNALATVRDNANKYKYEIEGTPLGARVEKMWYVGDKKRKDTDYKDRTLLIISDDWSATNRTFKVVAMDYDGLIVSEDKPAGAAAKAPAPRPGAKVDPRAAVKTEPKKPLNAPLAGVAGVAAASVPATAPTLYRWKAGQPLKSLTPIPADEAKKILLKAAEGGPLTALAD
jgi:hypothetical protein